jgi:hypothetical protein
MTQDQKALINKANAQLSTGPKTDEGKAKSAQNAATHGLTSALPPLNNPIFNQLLQNFIKERSPQTPTQHLWVEELAHIAWKLKQIPLLESQILQNSCLTPAEHFAQEKPSPLAKLWNLHLRLLGRFNSLDRKLSQNGCPLGASTLGAPSACSGPSAPPSPHPHAPVLQNEPTAQLVDDMILKAMKSILQNEPTKTSTTRSKLASAIDSVPLPIP